ncbi:MFS transporter [Corynebacterium phocae]|uniref:MFS transporter n=1 Tax=Corynebacterium phocae TaxID=161895 RepID=A0A1L7D5C4_9CORY|nr:multidrug effflux MFS transporter [Corynebacterium phocae]APT93310.1 MFS transporter [Corynebacterium phocae]KAA8721641.1 multidrug effflux MFS transporter [Corynebacterium phocae]
MIPVPLLAVLALLSATAPFATDMYLPVLPAIGGQFGASPALVQLTLTGFFLGMGVGQLLVGPLSDVWGRKRLLVVAAGVALVASVGAATAPGILILIAARTLQGLGGGACVVLARAIVSDLATGNAAARAYSLLMAIGALAPAIAPIIGGFLAEPIGWRGIYWALVGLHAVQLLLAVAVVPATGGHSAGGQRLAGQVAANYLAVARTREFWGFAAATAFGFGALFCYIAASPFVIQHSFGFSPRAYSFIFAANALGLVLAALTNSWAVNRVGAVAMLRVGVAAQFLAAAVLLGAAALNAPVPVQLLCLFFCVGPTGLILGNSTALATGLLRTRAGAASALLGFVQSLAAGAVSPLVGLGHNPPVDMAAGMVACSLLAVAGAWAATAAIARRR